MPVGATIVDVAGRVVRALRPGPVAGSGILRWDGRTERGAAASGVYLVRLDAGAQVATARFAWIR